jgi:hypothetical protein
MTDTSIWFAVAVLAALAFGFAAGWHAKRGWLSWRCNALDIERREWRDRCFDLTANNKRLSTFADAALRSELERGQS